MIVKMAVAVVFAGCGAFSLFAAAQDVQDDGCTTASLCAAASDDQNPPAVQQPAAQQPPAAGAPQAPAAAKPPAAKPPEIDRWWTKSAALYTPIVEKWQFHADGIFSYMDGQGNTAGSTLDISGSGEVRKKRFTAHTFAQLSRKNLTYITTHSSVDYEERTLREQGDYDAKRYLTLVAGIEDYRNTLMFMNERLNVYGGVGSTLYQDKKKKHQLYLMGAAGHSDLVFNRTALLQINPREVGVINTSPSSAGFLGMQSWRWAPNAKFNFSEEATYMKYDLTSLGHRWTINLSPNFPLNKWFSFNVNYRIMEETNVIIQALHVLPQTRTFLLGIKVSI